MLAAAKARAHARRQQHSNHIDANGVARHSCGSDSDVTLTSAEDDVESEGSDSDVEDDQPLSLDDTTRRYHRRLALSDQVRRVQQPPCARHRAPSLVARVKRADGSYESFDSITINP